MEIKAIPTSTVNYMIKVIDDYNIHDTPQAAAATK